MSFHMTTENGIQAAKSDRHAGRETIVYGPYVSLAIDVLVLLSNEDSPYFGLKQGLPTMWDRNKDHATVEPQLACLLATNQQYASS
jgi:hypothetical protein